MFPHNSHFEDFNMGQNGFNQKTTPTFGFKWEKVEWDYIFMMNWQTTFDLFRSSYYSSMLAY